MKANMTPSHSSRPVRNCLTINNNKYKAEDLNYGKLKVFRLLKTCVWMKYFLHSRIVL